jgi:ferredoxin-NADP reductase
MFQLRIRLKERRTETADVISFIFDLGVQPLEYRPGQYINCKLDTLAFPDERGNRRLFSISSSPTEKGILMFTTKMSGSGFKETLRHVPIGYELTCEAPLGEFVMREEDRLKSHVFIAGGIGVTPYRSILRYAVDMNEPVNGQMLYFNRTSADIVFRQELEDMAGAMPTFTLTNVLTKPESDWTGEQGKMDEALLRKYISDPDRPVFWISGPPPMVNATLGLLKQIGVKDEAIRTDRFGGY